MNASSGGRFPASAIEPPVVGKSCVSKLSFISTGAQKSGPSVPSPSTAWSISSARASAFGLMTGDPPGGAPAFPSRADAAGAGGHLPRPGQRDVGATDQPPAAPGPVDGESGGTPARRAAAVSGGHGRRGGVGARPAAQAVSLGDVPRAA